MGTLEDKHRTWVGAVELLQLDPQGPLENTSTPGRRGCFLQLKRGVQGGRVAGGGRGREPRGAVEERHTMCTQETQNVRDRRGG